MKLLKLAFGWLFNRWVISVIGITILCLLIWFLGPMIAVAGHEPLAGVEARFITIIVVIVIWAVWNLIVMARARKTNQEVLNDLVAEPLDPGIGPSDQVSQEEIERQTVDFQRAGTRAIVGTRRVEHLHFRVGFLRLVAAGLIERHSYLFPGLRPVYRCLICGGNRSCATIADRPGRVDAKAC